MALFNIFYVMILLIIHLVMYQLRDFLRDVEVNQLKLSHLLFLSL